MLASTKRMTEAGRPSTGQDIIKGRRTEIGFINGLVASKGDEAGIPAPTHAALAEVVTKVEKGELEPSPDNVAISNPHHSLRPREVCKGQPA